MVKGWAYGPSGAVRLPLSASRRLSDPSWPGGAFYPGVIVQGDDLLILTRVHAPRVARWFLARFDVASGKLVDGSFLTIPDHLQKELLVWGAQDARPFLLDGVLHAVIAVGLNPSLTAPVRQAIMRIDLEQKTITDAWLQPSDQLEKNWMPVIDGERLRLVYSPDPLIVFDVDRSSMKVTGDVNAASKRAGGAQRGSSQLVPYEGGWLCITHAVHDVRGKKEYAHRFAFLDAALTTIRFSPPWYLHHLGIEFVAGLAFFDGKYVLTYGVDDREAWLATVSPETVAAFLAGNVPKQEAALVATTAPVDSGKPGFNHALGGWGWG